MIITYKNSDIFIENGGQTPININKYSLPSSKILISKLFVDTTIPLSDVKNIVDVIIRKYPSIINTLSVDISGIIESDDVERLQYLIDIRKKNGVDSIIRFIMGEYNISKIPKILEYLESLVEKGSVNIGDFFYTNKTDNILRIVESDIYKLDRDSTFETLGAKLKVENRSMRLKLFQIFSDRDILKKLNVDKKTLFSFLTTLLLKSRNYGVITQLLYHYPIDKKDMDFDFNYNDVYLNCKPQLNSIKFSPENEKVKIENKSFEEFGL